MVLLLRCWQSYSPPVKLIQRFTPSFYEAGARPLPRGNTADVQTRHTSRLTRQIRESAGLRAESDVDRISACNELLPNGSTLSVSSRSPQSVFSLFVLVPS